jgi:Tol biopolymer transport system component
VAFILGRALAPADAGVRFEKFTPFATDAGYQGAPAWSPDGAQIAYEADVDGVIQIFTRTLGSARREPATRSRFDCYLSTWAEDGYIYYHTRARDKDALWRVSPVGGQPEMLIPNASESAISKDGKTVFFLRDESEMGLGHLQLWVASIPDGQPRHYSEGVLKDRSGSSGFLRFSPDGSRLLLWLGVDTSSRPDFWEIVMPDGEPRLVLPGLSRPGLVPSFFSWLPDNRHVVVTRSDGPTPGTHLWIADTKAPSRLASRLLGLGTNPLIPLTTTPGNESWPSVSPNGRTIAFTSEATDFDLFEVPLDGSPLQPFLSSTRNEYDPAASPANTQYAFVTDRAGNPQIWLQNLEGYLQQPIVTEADFVGAASMAVGSLAFSPDGTKLAFQRAATGNENSRAAGSRLWITPLSGGKPYPVAGEETYQDAPTWSPNGEWIAYLTTTLGDMSLSKAEVGGRAAPVTLIKSGIPPFVARPQWSPDGRWILCETVDGLTLVPADGKGESRVISDRGWFAYAWDKDGRRIYGLRPTDDEHHFMLVSLDSQTKIQRVINPNLGTWQQALQPIRGFSRLGNRGFLTSIARVRSDIYLIEGFQPPRTWLDRLWGLGRSRN